MPETAEVAIHILLLDDYALFRESCRSAPRCGARSRRHCSLRDD